MSRIRLGPVWVKSPLITLLGLGVFVTSYLTLKLSLIYMFVQIFRGWPRSSGGADIIAGA